MPKFDFDAYHRDTRGLGHEARSIWMDLLGMMNRSPRRGYLLLPDGTAPSRRVLASATESTPQQLERALERLEAAKVYGVEGQIIFSRRMVREERKRALCSQAGHRGGGSPLFVTFKGQPKGAEPGPCKGHDPPTASDYAVPEPKTSEKTAISEPQRDAQIAGGGKGGASSSNLICFQEEKISNTREDPQEAQLPFESGRFKAAWNRWMSYRKAQRYRKWKPATIAAQFARFQEWGEDDSIRSIDESIAQGWQGLFGPGRRTNGYAGASRTSGGGQRYEPQRCDTGTTADPGWGRL